MAGNARGKLKEHFEGIHRNFDWCFHHINLSLQLIEKSLRLTQPFLDCNGDEEKIQKLLSEYPLGNGIRSLGEGIQTLDDLAQGIYKTI